ncbi:HEAT repeat domain-containing protein [Massilia sp. IC2-477]|uniref:HEAT repeat domain-containing protein n=1 Tax=unclassified Massilia TaxID=2609279 RepID=UPI001D115762|nr:MULTISPECIES: HEAT repeat domain-containing protein [unclassified Massilia]MCC2955720.1 HEAT repeat domain-containing protein [Massilia sp. IC2-477]MCC2970315.1 HEAT repeat domain-containing protein [Massilia sp. IC2-476]
MNPSALDAGASSSFVTIAVWTGAIALGLTLLLALQIVLLRMALRRRERRAAAALQRWRPLLNQAIVGEQPDLPALAPRERLPFLHLWAHLQGSLRGEASEALNTVARRLGVDSLARGMLARGARDERLLASLVLGHLRDREAWSQLLALARTPDSALSLTALWALVRVDPDAAAEYLTPLFIEREDWALSHVAGILQQASSPVAQVLARLLPQLGEARLPRALRIAESLRVTLPAGVLAGALRSTSSAVVIAALRGVRTPETLPEVRALLGHEDWQVRVQAARALGRVGERSDAARLTQLLGDPQWWVRYRAAQALRELPLLARADLEAVRASLTDRFALDMLDQVLAEEEA